MKKYNIALSSTLVAIAWVLVFLVSQFTFLGILIVGGLTSSFPGNDLISIIAIGIISLVISCSLFVRRRSVAVGVVILFFGTLVSLNGTMWFARDHSRNNRMVRLKNGLESYRSKGILPESLEQVPSLAKLLTGPFGVDPVKYRKIGSNYEIQSYCVPLGPFELYSSRRADWYYQE